LESLSELPHVPALDVRLELVACWTLDYMPVVFPLMEADLELVQ